MALKSKKRTYEAEDQADVVAHFRQLANLENERVKGLKFANDKLRAELRAEAFDEAAEILENTTVAEW